MSSKPAAGADRQIRAVLDAQVRAWNAGDLRGFMEGYARSGRTRFQSGGDVSLGWQTVFERYQNRYADRPSMGTLAFSEVEVSPLAPDAALAFGRWRVERAQDATSGLFTLLFRRTPAGWRIVHDHTSVAAQPPSSGQAESDGTNHWSFQPILRSPIPGSHLTRHTCRNPIDAFLCARLAERGLTPAPEAARRTLIRRLHFDLIGMPPAPEQVSAFLRDPRPDAYEQLVVRQRPDGVFGAFDCPDGGQIAPKRTRSTTPLQALNLLNSGFMMQAAGRFAARLEREAGNEVDAQVQRAFLLAFQRVASAEELKASAQLTRAHGLKFFCRALFNANEFVYVY